MCQDTFRLLTNVWLREKSIHITRSDRETAVYVLSWIDIEKLILSVQQKLPDISISVLCSDKLERYFSDIEDFESYRNTQRSSIKELNIVAKNSSISDRISITFNEDKKHNIRFAIDTNEDIAINLNDYFTDFLDSIRPWFNWIALADWYLMAFIIAFFVHFGNFAIIMYQHPEIFIAWSNDDIPDGMLVTGTFSIGDGVNRNKRNEVIRTVIIAAFSISILSSFIVAWVQ